MAASETSICNLALGRLGDSRILALSDANQPARYCSIYYAPTRDEVLRDHPWNFATTRATLSQLSTPPAFGWAFQYQLPVDCLRVLQLNAWEADESRPRWEVEGNVLLSDEDTAQVRFVTRVTNANLFDPLFVEALSLKLAAKLSQPLTGSRTQGGELLQEYESLISKKARKVDANEQRVKRKLPWVESDFVRARSGR